MTNPQRPKKCHTKEEKKIIDGLEETWEYRKPHELRIKRKELKKNTQTYFFSFSQCKNLQNRVDEKWVELGEAEKENRGDTKTVFKQQHGSLKHEPARSFQFSNYQTETGGFVTSLTCKKNKHWGKFKGPNWESMIILISFYQCVAHGISWVSQQSLYDIPAWLY